MDKTEFRTLRDALYSEIGREYKRADVSAWAAGKGGLNSRNRAGSSEQHTETAEAMRRDYETIKAISGLQADGRAFAHRATEAEGIFRKWRLM